MLQSLHIQQFILIEDLTVRFAPGVCVLTGETGAGKSILIDAVGAVLGGKAGSDLIRTGAERARLEATFTLMPEAREVHAWLKEAGITPEIAGELTLSREITPKGSRCRVEGVQVPLAGLRDLGEHLVDILGQHEHTLLTRAKEHLHWLDRYGGPDQEALRAEVSSLHARRSAVAAEARSLREAAAERARQRDFWVYQLEEITAAEPLSLEEGGALKAERSLLAHAEDLKRTLEAVHDRLTGGDEVPSLVDGLSDQIGSLRDAARVDAELGAIADSLDEALDRLEEASRQVRRRAERLDPDPGRLHEIDKRLDVLGTLERKYGPTMEQVLTTRDRLARDLDVAEHAEERLAALAAEEDAADRELRARAAVLTGQREAAARRLEMALRTELADLGMKEARFEVALRPHDAVTAEGCEAAEFLLAANPGEPPRALAKTASGGELARVMLALKTVLVRGAATPTLIFDEVDTGISGRAAQVVAQKLAQLGGRGQILLITHMPAIAAIADAHWHIEKRLEGGRTSLAVEQLDAEGQVAELAHLASGAAEGAALEHARELLVRARTYKGEAVAP